MLPCADTQDDSSDGYQSASDITLHDEDDDESPFFDAEPVTAYRHTRSDSLVFFPFHLIAGCGTAERAMCQFSRSMTEQEVRKTVVVKGTYVVGWWRRVG